jgi:ketosteroid isomerase-like protein
MGSQPLQRLRDFACRQAILNALAVHSRGVDRADANLLNSAYHADATVDYGFFSGPARELVAMLAAAQKTQPVTLHRTSNMWIAVDGDTARSESYVLAYVENRDGDTGVQRFVGGRYLDRHALRDGEWRLTHRTYVMDFNTNWPSTAAWADPAVALDQYVPRGGHGAADPGRALLALAAAKFATGGNSRVATQISDQEIDRALSRQALHDLCMAYARGVDRADTELLASIFHDDATVVSGVVNGSGAKFAAEITAFVKANLERCFHSVANEWFDIRGDRAVGESYAIATMTAGGNDVLTGGRYLDEFERRNDTWKFSNRTFVCDWTMTQPTSHQKDGFYAALTTRGRYGRDDPVYAFWNDRA